MTVYVVAGIVVGSAYAIATLGLILTYTSSRVFNFAQGAIAFFLAMTFHDLVVTQGWNPRLAGFVTVFVLAPLLGLFLWAVLFRRLSDTPPSVRLVATIGLFVALPPITAVLYGDDQIFDHTSVTWNPPHAYKVLGVGVDSNQIAVVIAAALVAVLLTLLLKATPFGLSVRATVDSPAMAATTGVNTTFVTAVSWMLGTMLAGAAGVLLGPIQGFDMFHFTVLMLVSFAAVVVARMHSLVLGFAGAMLIGLAQQLAKSQQADDFFGHVLGKDSVLFHGIAPSIPFIIMLVFLLAYSGLGKEAFALDDRRMVEERPETRAARPWWRRLLPLAVVLTGVLVAPVFLSGLWEAIFAKGLALGIIMLSITVVTGEGGMISLCQATFAGVAGAITAQLATNHGMPVIYAIVLSALIVVPIGMLAALPSLRLGGLYLALATLAFAQLVENTYFQVQSVNNDDQGVVVPRPVGFTDDLPFYYLLVGCFIVVALVVRNLKRSTTGLELVAMRSSEPATATLGVSIVRSKLVAFGVSAFIAGIGGALYATYSQRIVPVRQFNAIIGIVWFAVLVTWGMRSIAGALVAGLSFAVLPQLFSEHLSGAWLQLPTILFGLGAIGLAREPRGVMYQIVFGRRNRQRKRRAKRAAAAPSVPDAAVVS